MKIFITVFLSTALITSNLFASLIDRGPLDQLNEAYHQDDQSPHFRTPRGHLTVTRTQLLNLLRSSNEDKLKKMLLAVYWYGNAPEKKFFLGRIHKIVSQRVRSLCIPHIFPGWHDIKNFPLVSVHKDTFSFSHSPLLNAVLHGKVEDVHAELERKDMIRYVYNYIQTVDDGGNRLYPLISFAVLRGCNPAIVEKLRKHSLSGMLADARFIAYKTGQDEKYEKALED